jgi:hypothetical protein
MHKYQWLRICADEFKKQLEEYAKTDEDVAQFLKNWMPLYEKIQRKEVRLPYQGWYGQMEFHRDDYFPMARKYGLGGPKNPLGDAQVKFSIAINDWYSFPRWGHFKTEEMKNPLDEPPPPEEEEAPLPKPPPPPSEPVPWWKALSNKLADGLFAFLKNVCG